MIECIFSIDYEIYGNGQGRLIDLVYEPARKLQEIFDNVDAKFVNFVEAAEFAQMEQHQTDKSIFDVRRQIRDLHAQGHEIGLHIHPQWANGRFENGRWHLDYSEYNLCVLSGERIARIVDDAIAWLRDVVNEPAYTPLAFRAGNWLFQPTALVASVLASRGILIDSSVFKGGRQHQHNLDYRRAQKNGHCWRFGDDVNVPDENGPMLEIPIHTQMVPFWRVLTGKRLALQKKRHSGIAETVASIQPCRLSRLRDYARFRYPLKFDFCRMTFAEMISMVENVIGEDRTSPSVFKPLVAIGHTKDLLDFDTVVAFLDWLKRHSIRVSTFESVYSDCISHSAPGIPERGVS